MIEKVRTQQLSVGDYVIVTLYDGREYSGTVWYGTHEGTLYLNSGAQPPHIFKTDMISSTYRINPEAIHA